MIDMGRNASINLDTLTTAEQTQITDMGSKASITIPDRQKMSTKKVTWRDKMQLKQQQRKHNDKLQQIAIQKDSSERKVASLEEVLRKIDQRRNTKNARTKQDGFKYHPTGAWAIQESPDKELPQQTGWSQQHDKPVAWEDAETVFDHPPPPYPPHWIFSKPSCCNCSQSSTDCRVVF